MLVAKLKDSLISNEEWWNMVKWDNQLHLCQMASTVNLIYPWESTASAKKIKMNKQITMTMAIWMTTVTKREI